MRPQIFRNMINNEILECQDPKDVRIIEGVEYLVVTQSGHHNNRSFMIRRDSLRKIEKEKK